MGKSLKERVQELVEQHFPWGTPGFSGPMPDDSEERERMVRAWIEEQTREFGASALALIARIQEVLRELETRSLIGGPRLLARIDSSALRKTPDSILERMVRSWPAGSRSPHFSFGN